jgi:hypothetical protein
MLQQSIPPRVAAVAGLLIARGSRQPGVLALGKLEMWVVGWYVKSLIR